MSSLSVEESHPGVLAACSLGLLAAQGMMPPVIGPGWRLLPGVFASLLLLSRWRRPGPVLGLCLMVVVLNLSFGAGLLWQAAMPLAVAVLWFVARARPALESPLFQVGRIPVMGTLVCAFVTPLALGAWVYFLLPDLSDLTAMIPDLPVWLLVLGATAFALLNALFEECVWRGVIQARLAAVWGVPLAIFLQALSFGLAHTWGFPRGVVGVVLASSWAVMLGVLRQISGGLLAPLLAHIVADASIAAIVLLWL